RRQRNSAAGIQDVQFNIDLAQELIQECRRLQVSLDDRDKRIKEAETSARTLESTVLSLEERLQSLSESEDKYKEENWNLEMRIQELESDASLVSHRLSKANFESSKHQELLTTHLETLEILQQRENELKSENLDLKSQLENNSLEYESVLAKMRAENELLTMNVETLTAQLKLHPSQSDGWSAEQENSVSTPTNELVFNEFDALGTPDRSPPISPVKATPAHNAALEGQTLRASLAHAQRMIASLRNALHRERTEKLEIKRMLTESDDGTDSARSSFPRHPKRAKNRNSVLSRKDLLGNGGKRTEYHITEDTSSPFGMEWETFNGSSDLGFDSFSDGEGFETANDNPTSDEEYPGETDDYLTGVESFNDYDAENDEWDVNTSPQQHFAARSPARVEEFRYSSGNPLFTSHASASDRRKSDLFATPQPLLAELGSDFLNSTTPTKSNLALSDLDATTDYENLVNRKITPESVLSDAATISFTALSTSEYENIVNRKVTPQTLKSDAAEISWGVLPLSELDLLVHRKLTPESVKADAESISWTALSKSELELLTNRQITSETVIADAESISWAAIPQSEYNKLVNRIITKESVISDAQTLSMTVLSNDVYKELLKKPVTHESLIGDAATLGMTLSLKILPLQEYENLNRKREVTAESVTSDAALLSLTVLPTEEYLTLIEPKPVTIDGLKNDASKLSMSVIPPELLERLSAPHHAKLQQAHYEPISAQYAHEVHSYNYDTVSEPHSDKRNSARVLAMRSITQCMLGNYMWKYTRRSGKQSLSDTRHRRYFWLQPYTKTLHWSRERPVAETSIKARSAQIQSIQVVDDANPFPPGLYQKSIYIKTTSRVLQLTCLTQAEHESWCLAISFLLMKTGALSRAESNGLQNAGRDFDVREFSGSGITSTSATKIAANAQQLRRSSFSSRSITAFNAPGSSLTYTNCAIPSRSPSRFRVRSQGSMGRLTSLLRPPTGKFSSPYEDVRVPKEFASNQAGMNEIISSPASNPEHFHDRTEFGQMENVRACCDGIY
ncbi:meiotic cell cortex C-terminal pleckstrin homology-domain-containing protein, partial [Lipomyces oligophaga]|uniref:meiotic cell cortex C-terminal pleckstrin homology-domain-containing protein n=1 Tax=Lipomyces oligophaga TaxID=45792 RepID=UPI0034CD0B2D